jgi:hypothetical protein
VGDQYPQESQSAAAAKPQSNTATKGQCVPSSGEPAPIPSSHSASSCTCTYQNAQCPPWSRKKPQKAQAPSSPRHPGALPSPARPPLPRARPHAHPTPDISNGHLNGHNNSRGRWPAAHTDSR